MTSPKTLSILFVDDEADVEPMVRLKLRRQIRNGTYDIAFATDGRDALKRLALDPRPIVVTEYLSFMKPLRKLDSTVSFRGRSRRGDRHRPNSGDSSIHTHAV